jgi:hypothetical protein
MSGWMGGGWMDGWVGEWVDGGIGGCMGVLMEGWMRRLTSECYFLQVAFQSG